MSSLSFCSKLRKNGSDCCSSPDLTLILDAPCICYLCDPKLERSDMESLALDLHTKLEQLNAGKRPEKEPKTRTKEAKQENGRSDKGLNRAENEKTGALPKGSYNSLNKRTGESYLQRCNSLQNLTSRGQKMGKRGNSAAMGENENWQKVTKKRRNRSRTPYYTRSDRGDLGLNESIAKSKSAKQIISTSSDPKPKRRDHGELKETARSSKICEQTISSRSQKQEPQSLGSVQQSKDTANAPVKTSSLFGYKCLEELSEKEPSEVLVFIARRRDAFQNTLKQHLKPDHVALMIKILATLCVADFDENKVSVLSCACKQDFIIQVSKYIMSITVIDDRDKNRHKKIPTFFKDLLVFLESVINLLPNHIYDVFDKIFTATEFVLKFVAEQESNMLEKELMDKFALLKERFKICMQDENRKKHTEGNLTDSQPPDDFRAINVFPEPEDILSKHCTFLRPNIVNGAYESIEHYLDVQFRLLREDFIGPIREGILEYIENFDSNQRNKKRINNVRIYPRVFFKGPKVVRDKIGLEVSFDPDKRLKNVVWEHSKRFLFGSLLLFSMDNFKTVIFATVVERDVKDLKQGQVVVHLSETSKTSRELFEGEFVMAESEVYFEPYYHILKALQNMNEHNFPMKKYLVEVNTSVNSPSYTLGDVQYAIGRRAVTVMENRTWPTAAELGLDSSQYAAFRSALTNEFVVIQGPPGTGKTFLGLRIAQVLLNNEPIWNTSRKPILVVCYTNHALDQFLEGIAGMTNKIVRVGGQSKSSVLQSYFLREKRRMYRTGKSKQVSLLGRDIHLRMCDLMSLIKRTQKELEMMNNHHGIAALAVLKEVGMRKQHEYCFGNDPTQREILFLQWLEGGLDQFEDYILPGSTAVPKQQEEQQQENKKNCEEIIEHEEPEEMLLEEHEDLFRHMLDDLMDFELGDNQAAPRLNFILNFEDLDRDIDWINIQLSYLNKQILEDPTLEGSRMEMLELRDFLELRKRYMISQLKKKETFSRQALERLWRQDDLWALAPEERWSLYKQWVNLLQNKLLDELHLLEEEYKTEAGMYEEVQMMNDLEILRDSVVVGMTTTCAARLQKLLQALKAKIGDHQQLRPSPAVFKLAREYNLDISLFERMIKNGLPCEVLTVQHRMRPEVAELICPSIYASLINHSSVLNYEKIHGVLKNVFFVTHSFPEQEVADSTSRRNTHEGDFLIALCRYLVLQGYSEDQITILTTYAGQMFYLRGKQKNSNVIRNVRITVVDNFQGEENDIILLSLVRSNKEAKIGFLKTENRVCVALSRAKKGLYIIGNMDNLTKSSTIWKDIKATLIKQEAVDSHLILRCQVHLEQFTKVSCAEDFSNVPEGGCKQLCGAALQCGHKCKRVCHVTNREHKNYRCYEPCNRVPANCDKNHRCEKVCWQDCGSCQVLISVTLPCDHTLMIPCSNNPETYPCPVKVDVVLPCEHKASKPCHKDIKSFRCPHPCEDRLPCGHSCELPCHIEDDPDHLDYKCSKPCTNKNVGCKEDHPCTKLCHEECGMCSVWVVKDLPNCQHKARMHCSEDVNSFHCKRRCEKILPCSHPCPNLCYNECGNCSVKVSKILPSCGHSLQVECSKAPDPRDCRSKCKRTLLCGHKCTALCSEPCTKNCLELVPSKIRPVCGHAVYIPCHMQHTDIAPDSEELLSRCEMPCSSLLSCGHRCRGTCSGCLQGRIHEACKEACGRTLVCGHSCNIPCAALCPPCNRKCKYKCIHSRCPKKCGQPCVPCKEPCAWRCVHLRCTKRCHEFCNRGPCEEPCRIRLKCGHPCIGFCGEKCPTLCRICNEEEVTEIFFGNEDEPDARFVVLEDCDHIFESKGLEEWMMQSNGAIKLKVCPRCSTPVTKTQRYLNSVKQVFKDVQEIKRRIFGKQAEIVRSRDSLRLRLQDNWIYRNSSLFVGSKLYMEFEEHLDSALSTQTWNRRRKEPNIIETQVLSIQLDIFSQLTKYCVQCHRKLSTEAKTKLMSKLDFLLGALLKRQHKISAEEVRELNMEVQRFCRLCQLFTIESEGAFRLNKEKLDVKESYKHACNIAYSIERFTEAQDSAMRTALERLTKVLKSAVTITEAEKREIVQAMAGHVRPGAWYKCPNGHIYCITECGGAMQQSVCPDCKAAIGGSSHRLLPSNQVATEMDGARRPAWPQ